MASEGEYTVYMMKFKKFNNLQELLNTLGVKTKRPATNMEAVIEKVCDICGKDAKNLGGLKEIGGVEVCSMHVTEEEWDNN